YEPDPEYSAGYSYRGRGAHYSRSGYVGSKSIASAYGRAPKPSRSSAPDRASGDSLVGTRVRHSKFGIGTIISVDGEGDDRRLTVSFQDYGPKKLLERYANLQIAWLPDEKTVQSHASQLSSECIPRVPEAQVAPRGLSR